MKSINRGPYQPPVASPSAPPAPVAPTPAPTPWLTVTPDRVDLVTPHIWLDGHLVVRNDKGVHEQVRELRPKRAFIAEGALIIEEMDLILPLAGVIIRKEKP